VKFFTKLSVAELGGNERLTQRVSEGHEPLGIQGFRASLRENPQRIEYCIDPSDLDPQVGVVAQDLA
jgi:hypothetical protein